jgi:3-deoxy-D-manno-octulosonic acid kinase
MNPVINKEGSLAIAYDASLMENPGVDFFNVDYWVSLDAVNGKAFGRGSAWFIDSPVGPVVLRKYLRGGWVAKISRQSYFFTSVSRSRPIREFLLLTGLHELGLPVPRPIAALCEFHGFISSGAILTARIPSVQTLADLLPVGNNADDNVTDLWQRVGKCIRKFHDAGVWHADLNARNILLDTEFQVFLIDFDRARFTPGKMVNGQRNLNRLKRSLVKLWPPGELPAIQTAWTQLKAGYDG